MGEGSVLLSGLLNFQGDLTGLPRMSRSPSKIDPTALTDVLAIDCGMIVTVDSENRIGRCSVVNLFGRVVLDVYVEPEFRVLNYRTRSSGITRKDIDRARNSGEIWTLELLQDTLLEMFLGRVVVGHDVVRYLDAVEFSYMTCINGIDTQTDLDRYKRSELKDELANFGVNIQDGKRRRSSVENACATMLLYRVKRKQLDKDVFPHWSC